MKSKNKTPEVNFEELTDIILGATNYLFSKEKREKWKDDIVKPLKNIYNKLKRKKNLEKSGHYRNFNIQYVDFDENNNMKFNNWNLPLENNNVFEGLQYKFNFKTNS
jgi:hypothetical protein